jgi:hypothetical protein
VVDEDEDHSLVVPLSVAFGNPDLLEVIGEGKVMAALGGELQYKNDEQIDNTMRSVMFEIPKPGTTDPTACQTPVVDPRCFSGVVDLGAVDVERGRDHGIPNYNALRRAYGLAPKSSFAAITGEASEAFPNDPLIDQANPANDPDSLGFTELRDKDGVLLDPDDEATAETAVTGTRRTPLAARLKSLYGSPDTVDSFVGMVSEPHVAGSELGELQKAIWTRQFRSLRDGDRFFFAGDPVLSVIRQQYGISVLNLSQVIAANTDATVGDNPFKVPPE